ncbi:hypothetical protein DASC09_005070 [Saccharomycopsis crataegensis]|uniref:Uncharacterized protein n=1 Tax=Saccharomycopsis crataegensis TaxID=43959 RepID=A0AAV5QEZ3_9ASCO|nr:hypothetical protein DASC09_005070 [Saccharomycopsis crataegensis]
MKLYLGTKPEPVVGSGASSSTRPKTSSKRPSSGSGPSSRRYLGPQLRTVSREARKNLPPGSPSFSSKPEEDRYDLFYKEGIVAMSLLQTCGQKIIRKIETDPPKHVEDVTKKVGALAVAFGGNQRRLEKLGEKQEEFKDYMKNEVNSSRDELKKIQKDTKESIMLLGSQINENHCKLDELTSLVRNINRLPLRIRQYVFL